MANLYVDHVGGSDTTGNGTKALPYKTVEKAVVGLVGGDEVRCAQTTQVDLNGTLTFTNNSTSVATTQDLTSQVAVNDCIRHPADLEAWWPVASLTSSAITLKHPYWGTDGSGKTAKRMRPVVITSNPEIFDHRGLGEPGNLLKVIGGWDFNTDTQVGLTALNNLSTGSAPQCFHFDEWTTEYVEVGYIELSYFYCFTGYNYALNLPWNSYAHHIYWSGGNICLFWGGRLEQSYCGGTKDVSGCNALGTSGGDPYPWSDVPHNMTGWYDFSMKDIWVYSSTIGFEPYLSTGVIDNVNFFNTKNCAMDLTYVGNLYVQNCMFDTNRTATDGLLYVDYMCQNVHFYNCVIKNSIGYGVEFDNYDDSDMAIFINCTFENNAEGDFENYNVDEQYQNQLVPIFTVSNPNGESVRYYKDMATIHHTATESRSGKCLKFTPRDVSFSTANKQNLMDRVGTHKIQSIASAITLGIYLKKSSDFNGTVYFLAIRNGCWLRMPEQVTGLTESYAQKTYVVGTDDLILNEVLEFFVLVEPGTAGSVYADDFSGET